MSWIGPLLHKPRVFKRAVRSTDGALMPPPRPREVTINGVTYGSMTEACQFLGWSYSKVYKAIGEGWRYAKK